MSVYSRNICRKYFRLLYMMTTIDKIELFNGWDVFCDICFILKSVNGRIVSIYCCFYWDSSGLKICRVKIRTGAETREKIALCISFSFFYILPHLKCESLNFTQSCFPPQWVNFPLDCYCLVIHKWRFWMDTPVWKWHTTSLTLKG